MTLITAKWNITDYHRMISAGILQGKQVELINGEIVKISPEGEIHAYASDEAGEYFSSLSKDIEVKTKVYAEAGIAEYWVINLHKMELVAFRDLQNTGYQSQDILTQGEIHPLAFPDITVSVQQLLGL